MKQTFFFYDLETSGLDSRADRIMQFAGQRTDLDLNPIGDPINLLVKLPDDTLPSPYATLVTGITPQKTQQDGLTEAEFCKYIIKDIFTPNTIAIGYNSVRFDDEFMRHLLWRNFYDPYEWQWKDGRSRWDILDVIRLTRALRPEGISWPFDKDGKATNRLELITKLNNISHEAAHDALSDVTALIDVTKLIKTKQPKLFDYLLKMRDKKSVQKLVNLENPQPFVYASGRLPSEYNKTSVFYPLAPAPNGNVIVYDLRHNLEELNSQEHVSNKGDGSEKSNSSIFPIVKELKYNRCPAVAPISVLDQSDGWEKIQLDKEIVAKNRDTLLKNPTFAEQMREFIESKPEFPPAADSESALYDGFLDHSDRIRCDAVRNAKFHDLADFHPEFSDPRLPDLLTNYKARNFPDTMTEHEQQSWEAYRTKRLERQAPTFINDLESLAAAGKDTFIIEELRLWYQSITP
jgi:exodeoxyribonuclease-1